MPIIESTGNLFDSSASVLVDLNNTKGVSGGGLAREFKDRIPEHYEAYHRFCHSTPPPSPGTCQVILTRLLKIQVGLDRCRLKVPRTVSMFTKDHWRDPSQLEWVDTALQDLRDIVTTQGGPWWEYDDVYLLPSVALAHPGCGLGGLNKKDVRSLIEKHLGDLPNKVYLFG